ncbi:MAG: hypothetical protein ABIR24_01320 [Verrucomicrobiota bacterium]
MKLRFAVDQAACFRKGIDCPKSIVTIEVDPKNISEQQRNLIADRLVGIDVAQLWNDGNGTVKVYRDQKPVHIVTESPDYEGLIAAIMFNEKEVSDRKGRHWGVALAIAEAGVDTVSMVEKTQN